MGINDIIGTYRDRLFTIDIECFIIFTGDSLDDEKPFIRIGNWIDMPVELIPLIENIIITDRLVGDPSDEQFSIDIKNIKSNKYIGSEHILKKYLEFQTLYGLDITNASIVNIDKDIPELSMEKNISGKNEFIGLFYRNGNFKILYNKKDIFNLESIERNPVNINKIHNFISDKNSNSERYKRSGILFLNKSHLFYNNNNFTSYFFPNNYFDDFINLDIDPAKINQIIFQSDNFASLSKFLIWKHNNNNKVMIFSDYEEQLSIIKNLFTNCIIKTDPFSGLELNTGQGMKIINYSNSNNLKIEYNNIPPDNDELTISIIVEKDKIADILKDRTDAIFINYSVYEKTNLLFKSTSIPVIIIDDGNKNILKIKNTDSTILYPGTQYEFIKYHDISYFSDTAYVDDDLISELYKKGNIGTGNILNKIMKPGNNSMDNEIRLFNFHSIVKLFLYNTEDRKFSRLLKEIYTEISLKINYDLLFSFNNCSKITLIFFNNSIFQFFEKLDNKNINTEIMKNEKNKTIFNVVNKYYKDDEWLNFNNKIKDDRIRLNKLLELYTNHSGYKKNSTVFKQLFDVINKRKKIFSGNSYKINLFKKTNNNQPTNQTLNRQNSIQNEKSEVNVLTITKRKIIMIPIVLSVIILILIILNKNKQQEITNSKVIKNSNVQLEETVNREIEYVRKYNIEINNIDIFNYANKIALKNNYNRIRFTTIKNKNPHWIYPSNKIKMLDNETIIVQKGDTLWNLSNKKLLQKSINFHKTVEKIKKNNDNNKNDLINKAKDYAFSKNHFKIIEELLKDKK